MAKQPKRDGVQDMLLQKLGESYSQVKLGPGVVGKTTRVTLGLVAIWLLIIWKLGENTSLNCFLLGSGAVITAASLWWIKRTQDFAEKHPDVALLEGAEFIAYQKWQAEVKGQPPIKSIPMAEAEVLENVATPQITDKTQASNAPISIEMKEKVPSPRGRKNN